MKNTCETLMFQDGTGIPNHPRFPVLIYRGVVGDRDTADQLESRFRQNGWTGCWRWGVYDFHHFHSNAHEVLGVASGRAVLALGGPQGETLEVRAGDVVVLPAGTGHKNEGASPDFQVVGAYPAGQEDYDLIRLGETVDDAVRDRITHTPCPETDPLHGKTGPLLEHWG